MNLTACVLVAAILAPGSYASQNSVKPIFNFRIGGGFPDSKSLNVDLFPNGDLIATTKGRPIKTNGELTLTTITKRLNQLEIKQILDTANKASQAPPTPTSDQVDFKWAGFGFRQNGRNTSCLSGPRASEWSKQPSVKALIDLLDSHLPAEMHFTNVLSE